MKALTREASLKVFKKLSMTPNHVKYNKILQDPRVVVSIAIGPAGSGKTLLPSAHAITSLLNKDIQKIIITRPTITLEETLGHLPGDINKKMHPFMVPIFDHFKEYASWQSIQNYINNETIEICPFAYIRGRTFHNSWIIADEVQNTSVNQMKSLLTRIGQNSKISMTGDLDQCDVLQPYGASTYENGLAHFVRKLAKHPQELESIKVVEFDEGDIMRSKIVKEILDVYKD